jgi:hypothetical protein
LTLNNLEMVMIICTKEFTYSLSIFSKLFAKEVRTKW